MKFLKLPIFILISLVLVLIDQFTKLLALRYLKTGETITIVKNIFEFVYVENSGAAFGILAGKQNLFYILTIVVLIFLLYVFYRTPINKHYLPIIFSFLLIFSGAIGNFVDRIKNHYVIDFIYFKPIDFPVFNFADICITIGTILLFICLFTINRHDNII